jgi:hypothetical protein
VEELAGWERQQTPLVVVGGAVADNLDLLEGSVAVEGTHRTLLAAAERRLEDEGRGGGGGTINGESSGKKLRNENPGKEEVREETIHANAKKRTQRKEKGRVQVRNSRSKVGKEKNQDTSWKTNQEGNFRKGTFRKGTFRKGKFRKEHSGRANSGREKIQKEEIKGGELRTSENQVGQIQEWKIQKG